MIDKEKLKAMDEHWQEVMSLAEQYGFILFAYGGTAGLGTHKNQLEMFGEEEYITRQQRMFGNYMEEVAR